LRRGFKMPFKIGPKQFIDFAAHPRWSLSTLFAGKPDMANFAKDGHSFDRKESRASAGWEKLARLRDRWQGKLIVKGVLSVDDALRLKQAGIDAIQVSSHGGRQLDGAVPPILCLQNIREALGANYPLFYDSGIRSGEDIVKAYALGADFVFLGRPFLFAMAGNREHGLSQLWDVLTDETSLALAQIGKASMADLGDSLVTLSPVPELLGDAAPRLQF